MKPLPSPSVDSSLSVPEFPEKSCQNNWNPHQLLARPRQPGKHEPVCLGGHRSEEGGDQKARAAAGIDTEPAEWQTGP